MVCPVRMTTLCVPLGTVAAAVPEPGVAAKAAANELYVSQTATSLHTPEFVVA